MKNEFTINIVLDATPRVGVLLKYLLGHIGTPEMPVETLEPEEPAVVKEPETKVPEVKEPETKEPETKEAEAEKPAEAQEAVPSPQDVRAAMQRVRNRFEFGTPEPGEEKGPEEKADPQLHRELTKLFKQLAKEIQANTLPSDLQPENRQLFIDRVADIQLTDDGFVAPF